MPSEERVAIEYAESIRRPSYNSLEKEIEALRSELKRYKEIEANEDEDDEKDFIDLDLEREVQEYQSYKRTMILAFFTYMRFHTCEDFRLSIIENQVNCERCQTKFDEDKHMLVDNFDKCLHFVGKSCIFDAFKKRKQTDSEEAIADDLEQKLKCPICSGIGVKKKEERKKCSQKTSLMYFSGLSRKKKLDEIKESQILSFWKTLETENKLDD
ncbi:Oidioi.mRNA.OKI2018_I69.chr2.g7535.t1.cds [Oikopleura dioica]|uniref:Oidioi.mRNA.OKI2018_I69.chr2.g7535.t1.cds n=1 Tax=Oikopleura dioica TaxID=34765 RepID=A0ABN7T7H5_OIKDI|nr:Oidioi.mRNA.OKI2018_I69.chr2.g7535.t1.cds [Oikopleura dioica]